MVTDAEIAQKKAFAYQLCKCTSAFEAAQKIFPDNIGRALQVSQEWVVDPFVVFESERLKATSPPEEFLPSKADLVRRLWLHATEGNRNTKDRNEAIKLIALMQGLIVPPKVDDGKGGGVIPDVLYMAYPEEAAKADA